MKLAAILSLTAATLVAAERPNILLVCVDDLKPIGGAYGGPAKTPAMDRFAERGVIFDRAFCNQAVCSPSRNALMSGLRPTTLGVYDLATNFRKARPNAITLGQHFIAGGYRTEAMGKIFHVGHGNTEDPASWSIPHKQHNSIAYLLPESRAKEGLTREEAYFSNKSPEKLPRGAAYESPDVADDAYPDGQIALEAVARLRAAKERGGAHFIAVGFLKPHLPFCAPKKYWDLYDRTKIELPARRTPPDGAPSYAPQFGGELRQYKDIPDKGDLPEDQQRALIHGYLAASSYMDAQFEKLITALDQTGLAANTIVILWGDHGWHLGDHSIWCKHTNYEQATRIPLIVAGPGIAKGRAAALVETVDIFPTLAELAGLPTPANVDGISFTPVLRDTGKSAREFAQHCYPRGERIGRAVRTAQHRLVEWKKPGAPADTAELELYDYAADPLETKNLATTQPEVAAKLRALLATQPEARPPWRAAPTPSKTDREELFSKKDTDKNGTLSREEFVTSGKPKH